MQITVRSGDVLATSSSLAILAVHEGAELPKSVGAAFEAGDFTGAANQTLLVYPRAKGTPDRVLLVGLGAKKSVDVDRIRQAAATAVRQARTTQVAEVTIGLPSDVAVSGPALGQALAEGVPRGGVADALLHPDAEAHGEAAPEAEGERVAERDPLGEPVAEGSPDAIVGVAQGVAESERAEGLALRDAPGEALADADGE